MKATLVLAVLACAYAAWLRDSIAVLESERNATPRESRVPVGGAELYAREIGQGAAIIVLHGGPDFDHSYLLPELDRLSDSFRLIYYDQRGRGRSADRVQPEDVTLASDIADLEKVRQYFHLDSVALLGHSWGTVLALEYALRYPERMSRMILNESWAGVCGRLQAAPQRIARETSGRHGPAESHISHRCLQRRRS